MDRRDFLRASLAAPLAAPALADTPAPGDWPPDPRLISQACASSPSRHEGKPAVTHQGVFSFNRDLKADEYDAFLAAWRRDVCLPTLPEGWQRTFQAINFRKGAAHGSWRCLDESP